MSVSWNSVRYWSVESAGNFDRDMEVIHIFPSSYYCVHIISDSFFVQFTHVSFVRSIADRLSYLRRSRATGITPSSRICGKARRTFLQSRVS